LFEFFASGVRELGRLGSKRPRRFAEHVRRQEGFRDDDNGIADDDIDGTKSYRRR
jgi:hypothetical protein